VTWNRRGTAQVQTARFADAKEILMLEETRQEFGSESEERCHDKEYWRFLL